MDGLEEWMASGEYLPEFMRDFHDQKDLFKAVFELIENARAKDPTRLEHFTWVDCHVFTVDFFLWFMARRGYTLQRTRRKFKFIDLHASIKAAMDRWKSPIAFTTPTRTER